MSFLFGGGGGLGGGARGRGQRELADGRRRAELRLARDIGNEAALRRDAEPPRSRIRMWPVAAVGLVMVLGAFGLLPKVNRVDIARSCTTPAVALDRYEVAAGTSMEWKATGPADGDYVLVADGGAVSAEAGQVRVADGGTALSGVFTMTDCLTDQSLTAPTRPGNHTLRLLHRQGLGDFTEVASVDLTVT